MIRGLIIVLVVLGVGSVAAALLREDPGYVLINIGGYTLESTVAALVGLLLFSLAAIVLLYRLARGSVRLPGRVAEFMRNRRSARAQAQFRSGLMRLAAGQWQKAEIELLRRAADQSEPAANYIYAAEAAQRQNAPDRRDRYLALASESDPEAEPTVLMQRARLLADEGRSADALVELDRLAGRVHRHGPATELRLELLERLQNWTALRVALKDASGVVDDSKLQSISVRVWRHALSDAADQGQLEALRSTWRETPKSLRQEPAVLAHYARLLHQCNSDAEGVRLIRAQIKRAYDAELVLAFGDLHGGDSVAQLATVEEWIKAHDAQPELLLVAGRLCLRNRLWGRARSYFEAGLKLSPSPEIQLELGRLAQQDDDTPTALRHFQQGLELATNQTSPPGPASLPQVEKA